MPTGSDDAGPAPAAPIGEPEAGGEATAKNAHTALLGVLHAAAPSPRSEPRTPTPEPDSDQGIPTPAATPLLPLGLGPGARLGRYEIAKLIGAGGMGAVYRARDTRLKRHVALKTLSPGLAAEPNAHLRFEREAQAISTIHHPNLVQVYDFGVDGGLPYIVMELLHGQELAALLRREVLEVARAADIGMGICAGVTAAHDKGIVHRDLKPRNVFLADTPMGEIAKVLDFGVSKLPRSPQLTARSAIVGTTPYMAPEQAAGSEVDAHADQYAIGVMLYECVTGRLPHEGSTSFRLMEAIVAGRFEPPSRHREGLPRDFERIVLRAMSRKPEARFAGVHELGSELLPFASENGKRQWTHYYTTPRPRTPELSQSYSMPAQPSPGGKPLGLAPTQLLSAALRAPALQPTRTLHPEAAAETMPRAEGTPGRRARTPRLLVAGAVAGAFVLIGVAAVVASIRRQASSSPAGEPSRPAAQAAASAAEPPAPPTTAVAGRPPDPRTETAPPPQPHAFRKRKPQREYTPHGLPILR